MIYRNPRLLDLAREAPRCFHCSTKNDGTIVAAHRNQGKGLGIKSSDAAIAFLCHRCHTEIDNGTRMTREERRAAMDAAIVETMVWLIESGKLALRE